MPIEGGPLLVTGAGGGVGGVGTSVVKMLRDKGFPVRAMLHREDARADALRALGADVTVGDLTHPDDVATAIAGVERAYFSMSVSSRYLEAAATFATVAADTGSLDVIVNMSQMTVSQMTSTSTDESPQQRQHYLAERTFDWSGLPVVHVRPTVFLENPLFTTVAARSIAESDTLLLPFGDAHTSPISAKDVARVVTAIMVDPRDHIGAAYDLTGAQSQSLDQIAAGYSVGPRPSDHLHACAAGRVAVGVEPHRSAGTPHAAAHRHHGATARRRPLRPRHRHGRKAHGHCARDRGRVRRRAPRPLPTRPEERMMTTIQDLADRNKAFTAKGFRPGLTINPGGNLMVIGCVDPRVDPAHVLGLANGEAAIIRNVGGRITPATLRTMAMLSRVGQANAESRRPGDWNLVLLHHTDCGMTDLAAFPELLAEYFEIGGGELDPKAVSDPYASVRVDVDVISDSIHAPAYLVSGLVYDVDTGAIEVVVPPTQVPVG